MTTNDPKGDTAMATPPRTLSPTLLALAVQARAEMDAKVRQLTAGVQEQMARTLATVARMAAAVER